MLKNLLSATYQTSNKSEIEQKLFETANSLLHDYCLQIGHQKYRITEVEMYYFHQEYHADIYVYQKNRQLTMGAWYLHEYGVDITFEGNEEIYGGILLRGLRNLATNIYTSGPKKVLREIFEQIGDVFTQNTTLSLQPFDFERDTILNSTRVGLFPRQNDVENFLEKPYRFIVEANSAHKFKEKRKCSPLIL